MRNTTTSTGTMGTKARKSSHLISHSQILFTQVCGSQPHRVSFNCEIHEHSLTLLIVLMCTEGLVAAMRTDLLPWSHHGDLVQNTIVHLNHELESFSAGSSEIESRQPKVTPSTARGPSPLSCSSGLLPVSNGTCCTSFCSLILLSPITLSSEPRRKAHLLTPSVACHSLGQLLCTPKGGHMDLSG